VSCFTTNKGALKKQRETFIAVKTNHDLVDNKLLWRFIPKINLIWHTRRAASRIFECFYCFYCKRNKARTYSAIVVKALSFVRIKKLLPLLCVASMRFTAALHLNFRLNDQYLPCDTISIGWVAAEPPIISSPATGL